MEKTMGLVQDMLGYLGHTEPGPKHKFLTSVQGISGPSPLITVALESDWAGDHPGAAHTGRGSLP